ncbi:MAG: carotenoid oxygenase family protein [Gammaproteobacteria bacterium]|nr:carotenoid oxygenase family protein [Gammaproteobacteria bacterium]
MTNFGNNPAFTGFNAPFRAEVDVFDLEVEGELPAALNGAFYRVQPDFLYPPRYANDVPFNGDGHVSMFRFVAGHVDFKCRFVRTQRYKAQRAVRRALYGTYRNRGTDMPEVRELSGGTANTNLILHAGRLFALKEDSPPVQIDPNTLDTLDDYCTFNGKLKSRTFTAHPKLDPMSGEMVGFGYEAKGDNTDDVAVYSLDKNGEVNWEAWIKVPYVGMLHDFGLTQTHVTFLVIPLVVDMEQMKQGGVHFIWDDTMPTWFGVMRRGGDGKDLRWYKGPTRMATHCMNAFSDGTKVYADMDMAEGNQFPFFPNRRGPFDFRKASGRLTRLFVDLSKKSDTYDLEVLHPEIGVLPRADERYWSLPYKVGFMPVMDPTLPLDQAKVGNTGLILNTWTRFDHATGKSTSWHTDPVSGLQECQFVPRSQNAPEGDGWLIGLCNRYEDMRTDLLVLDALHLADGPVATVRLPLKLRNGVHGTWVSGDHLASGSAAA